MSHSWGSYLAFHCTCVSDSLLVLVFECNISEYFHIALVFFDYEKLNSTLCEDWNTESLFGLKQVQSVITSFTDFANATRIFFGPSDFNEHYLLSDLKALSLCEIVPNITKE